MEEDKGKGANVIEARRLDLFKSLLSLLAVILASIVRRRSRRFSLVIFIVIGCVAPAAVTVARRRWNFFGEHSWNDENFCCDFLFDTLSRVLVGDSGRWMAERDRSRLCWLQAEVDE